MDIRPGKGFTTAQSDEHQRNWSEKGWDWAVKHGNYDRSREHLNFEVARDGKIVPVDKSKTIPQRMEENLRERGIKDPNMGLAEPKYRTVVNVIFGGSRDRMHELAFGNQKVDLEHGANNSHIRRQDEIERWAQDMYRFACDKWGEQNIIGFYVHLDEMNPHAHCTVLPVEPTGKLSFNKVFGGNIYEFKERLYSLHDDLSKINEKWGLNRGDNIHETGAKHRTTEEYRRELSRECTTTEQQIEENREIIRQLYADIRLAERRIKGLSTMVANLEEKRTGLEDEIKKSFEELKAGKGDSEELHKQIRHLDYELQRVLESLSDKQEKLKAADGKLSELKKLEKESKEKSESYQDEIRQSSYNLEKQVRFRLTDALLSDLVHDFQNRIVKLENKAQDVFDDSLIKDIAERGEDIFKCAIYLYASYVDQATNFARGHGGGGGGDNDLPWGRKEDEDDRAWARRCLMRAHRMMQPPKGKNIRRK